MFGLSFLLALYLDNKKMALPDFVTNCLEAGREWVLELKQSNFEFDNEVSPSEYAAQNIGSDIVDAYASPNGAVELGAVHVACTDKINAPAQKQIYTWVDSEGIRNVSDSPRAISPSTPVEVLGTIQPESISLQFVGEAALQPLKHDIIKRVMDANRFFALVAPKHLVTPVSFKMRMFSNKTSYDMYRASVAPTLTLSQGFYRSKQNEAVVLVSNKEQGINTAVHEALHAINRHWYGTTARWLNEGLAEYAEQLKPRELAQSTWSKYLRTSPISLSQLFDASAKDWSSQSLQSDLYGASWAFVAFLFSEHKDSLSRILLQESENGCRTVAAENIEQIFGKPLAQLQREFDNWRFGFGRV
ncbi:hypothetical protein ACFO4O_14420 [Glaciecola siphonariae]|uniref:DUF1570 domain-containing protein n=1 Tax=Glaciecola siphonariae TaxID=521012 RepID=A0ABV9LXR9_9ALTE